MKIYFARHGESEANRLRIISNRNLPHKLTDAGREQARQLGLRLRPRSIHSIYTSPLLRAVETSAIIGKILNVQFEAVDELREYDCGIAEGRSDKAAWKLWQEEHDNWMFGRDLNYKIEGGESYQDVKNRFVLFIDGLINDLSQESTEILCVSHGGIYSVMLPLVMRNITPQLMMKYGFDYTSCIIAEPTPNGLVCIEWDGHGIA